MLVILEKTGTFYFFPAKVAPISLIPSKNDSASKTARLRLPHLLRASWQQTVDHLNVIRIERVPLSCWKNGVKRMVKVHTRG